MSIYIPPATNAVDFAAESFTPADLTPANQPLSATSPAARTAVDFALTVYTQPTYPYVGWELLPGAGSVTAALAWTEDSDVWSITGTASAPGVSASLAWTEQDDVWAITGTAGSAVTAALAWAEQDDVWAISAQAPAATTSGGLKHIRAQFRGVEDEAEKLARRIREGTLPGPVAPEKVDYARESARLAIAIARFRSEANAHRDAIAELKAQLRAEQSAKLEHQILLAEQAYQLAKLQEAVFLEEMEVLDVAYFAVTALRARLQ